MNAQDPRWGLNAKRDGPSYDISKDVLAYYLGPTDRHVEAYDVIAAHEDPSARIVWNNITNEATIGQPGTARFVHPVTGGGFSGSQPNPTPTPTPVPTTYTLNEALNYLTAKKGAPLTGEEINKAAARAFALGWDGNTNAIPKNIIHQIGDEFFGDLPDTVIEAVLTSPFMTYPVGTKVKITVG